MINELNSNKINTNMILDKKEAVVIIPAEEISEHTPGVKVTNHLSSLVNLMGSDNQMVDNKAKIQDLKNKINNHTYKIDLESLSDKLLNSGLFI